MLNARSITTGTLLEKANRRPKVELRHHTKRLLSFPQTHWLHHPVKARAVGASWTESVETAI